MTGTLERVGGGGNSLDVLIVGRARSPVQWAEDLRTGFEETRRAADVFHINARFSPARLEKLFTGRKNLHSEAVQRGLVRTVARRRPRLVLFLNELGASAALVARIHAESPGCVTAGWMCDVVNRPLTREEATFDRLYYFDSFCHRNVAAGYGESRVRYLPLAVNPRRFAARPAVAREPALVFAGVATAERVAVIRDLVASGVAMSVHGMGWPAPLSERPRRLDAAEMAALYGRYAGALNINQAGNTAHGLNLRSFEVPAARGLLVQPRGADLPGCFEPGREVLVYDDLAAVGGLLRDIVADPDRAGAIVEAGHRRVLAEHTFRHRAETLTADL